ncbi:hypothetical protein GCM10009127_01650 [Alteraurantiacibacter aestuarii]|uniref:Sensor histidine kinase n=1 Tax=Alteraurantiacibacter aestuarii TaxID=650004 RepID=A0A844ZNH9_9SPHN|nr:histidine kinase [Alteraurantiacibacter aestuarii]MXO88580.1 sensor histidine kinase [Alteraurantiacibacter aestuarii]
MNREKPEDLVARVPFSTVLASIVGLWVCYFLLTTLRGELVDLGFVTEAFWRRALASFLGILITIGLWSILRLFDPRPLWLKICAALLLSMPVAMLIAQSNQMVFSSMEERVFTRTAEQRGFTVHRSETGDLLVDIPAMGIPTMPGAEAGTDTVTVNATSLQGTQWQQLTEVAYGRYFMMLAWCALYLALLTGEKARAAERREGTYRRAAKAAELRSLRYQVNPHFLFNTLNSLSALVLTGKTQAAERMIQMLSTFYRRSLADDPTCDVTLEQEIALQKLYLDIESVRFPLRLVPDYQVPPDLQDCLIPGMILQPLVENSVKHAVAPSSGQVTITLAAREEYGRLVVTVSDDGQSAAGKDETRPGYGIGLANVRERLEARFGHEASIVSGPVPGGYATHLRLPILRDRHAAEAAE